MSIDLKFFMLKRGLTIEKMIQQSGAKTASDLINYAKSLDIAIAPNDENQINSHFQESNAEHAPNDVTLETVLTLNNNQPVLEKKSRGRKKAGKDV